MLLRNLRKVISVQHSFEHMRKYELMSPIIEGVVTLQRSRLFDLLAPY